MSGLPNAFRPLDRPSGVASRLARLTGHQACVAVAVAGLALAPDLVAQITRGDVAHSGDSSSARLEGIARSAGSGELLAGVQVVVSGPGAATANIAAVTGSDGRYSLARVPAGVVSVRARHIGYGVVVRTIRLLPRQSAQADFELARVATTLGEVVVTGSGAPTERRKLGNTVGTIDVTALRNAPIANVSEVLQGREPGVTVLSSGGLPGEGARIRIRGTASLAQSNEPIVYVDGVRVDNAGGFSGGIGGSGGSPSRLDDLNPDAIERVEILKGAAAATLYGTEASAGVVQIFTKSGASGRSQWTLHYEDGRSEFPASRYRPVAGFARRQSQADSLSAFWGQTIRPFEVFEEALVPWLFETGRHSTSTLSVGGGSDAITYFVSGRVQREDGPFSAAAFHVPGTGLDAVQDLSTHRQANASVAFFPGSRLRLRTTSMYSDGTVEVPNNNNDIYSPLTSVMRSKPERANATNPTGDPAFTTTREVVNILTRQSVRRFAGSATANYSGTHGFGIDATAGVDAVGQEDAHIIPYGWNVDGVARNNVTGARTVSDRNARRLTADVKGTWAGQLADEFSSSVVLGAQGVRSNTHVLGGTGAKFASAGLDVAGAGSDQTLFEQALEEVSGGVFAQEQLGWRDFVFATVGARYDRHSAFGANTGGAVYPKASLSVVPSSRPDWSSLGISSLLSTLRVRAAVGRSGLQPGAFDRLTTFGPIASATGAGVAPANLGNADLRPEVSTEMEGGAELGFWHDRMALEVTTWRREVRDLLVARQFAPSGGFRGTQLDNVGELRSTGLELGLKGRPLTGANVSVDFFANGAFLRERITSLGGAPPIKVGYYRYRLWLKEGHAPTSFFGAKLVDAPNPIDTNGDGKPDTDAELLSFLAVPRSPDAIRALLAPDSNGDALGHYLGKSTPDWSGSFGGTLTFHQRLRLSTLWEFRTGHYSVQNLTGAFQRASAGVGRNIRESAEVEATLLNPASTPEQRLAAARTWATRLAALSPQDGLGEVERADLLRLRELSVTFTLPGRWIDRTGARSAEITLAGRNLALFTPYHGIDPELNAIGRGASTDGVINNFLSGVDAWGYALPRRITLAATLGF